MNLWSWILGLAGLLAPHEPPPSPVAPATRRRGLTAEAVADALGTQPNPFQLYTTTAATAESYQRLFRPAPPPPGADIPAMAMDEANGWAGQWGGFGNLTENLYWLGFPYLAELTQRPEYRRISETIAREMTRRWIKIQAIGDDDKSDKIAALSQAIDRHRLQAKFRRLAELDGFFGRSHLYVDTGVTNDRDTLKLPLAVDPRAIRKGGLKRFHVIEPQWIYPAHYNSTEPLDDEYYVPKTWYVMGKEVHRTRLMTFIGREVPDMFKPTYSFGGLSLSQMVKPYIDNWLRTRQAVSDLVHSFSVPVLQTNMGSILNDGAAAEFRHRAQLFNGMRDNNNLMMLDKMTEDFKNVSTPLGSLDRLQAQSQEHIASIAGIPLVVLTGITPTGLNATSEGELQTWAQFIHAAQTNFFDAHLKTILKIIQLDLFGVIDPDITHAWEPLEELNEKERNEAHKQQADTDVIYVNAGVLGPDEIRQKLANEPDSPYQGLDLDAPAPGPPEQEEDPLGGGKPYEPGTRIPKLGGHEGDHPPPGSTLIPPLQDAPAYTNGREGDHTVIKPQPQDDDTHINLGPQDKMHFQVGAHTNGAKPTYEHTIIKPGEHDVAHIHLGPTDRAHIKLGQDKGFVESEHPRDKTGKFGEGGGGAVAKGAAKQAPTPAAKGQQGGGGASAPAAAASTVGSLTKTDTRAFTGEQRETKTKLSKQETGAIGEAVITKYLRDHGGLADAQPLNTEKSNYPVDLIGDHMLIEAKTGLVSNGPSAQKWRATIGQPSKTEAEWLKSASPEAKAAYNQKKMNAIMDRKNAVLAEYEQKLGKKVKAKTLTTILNPDTRTADIFSFDGFHHHLRWNNENTKEAYVGSYKY